MQLRPMTQSGLSRPRVVVAEPFAEHGLAVLRDAGIDVDSQVGRSRAELTAALADADGLIVRSETRVDRELLAAGPKLTVVARAGVGVDAIDVDAATDAGIIVLNTPGANTIAATEQTFALMLALARRTPEAVQLLRQGVWDRKKLIGTELFGKTLGIVGLGRIGGNVAQRARAFGMTVIAHDPYITAARADAFDVTLVDLDTLLRRSDIVTLHVPLTPQTTGMIGAAQLALLQPHAYLINCARGGVIVERDLLEALDANVLAGAGIDVVAIEPPPPEGTGAALHSHPKVFSTPHLGGSTHEALARIATELAQDVARVLLGAPANAAVNAPVPDGPEAERVFPFLDVAYRLGRFYPQYARSERLPQFTLVLGGALADVPSEALVRAFLSGLLQATTDRRVSVVNAEAIARELGITVDARGDARESSYAASLKLIGGDVAIAGTSVGGSPRIVELDGYEIDATPVGAMLITRHQDVPGMIGRVGTILGDAGVNISTMQVSRNTVSGDAIMVLSTDRPAAEAEVAALRAIAGITSVRVLDV
ncbi:D-3-phosphoglycerate dehydrogenase [Vulcanimicrobium alpinum]|uniref:D-3-phosphoglycerate dehydrogenase n=1 Tax=Vulcanimicrobium alpinum TaxID=3016050 RepID=A0AAN2CAW7_UNVUL|nr:D-3-phosphoglycerate dehydrogenase [Vulcanimicrobium alpinum]